jgi:hypothetical protein
MKGKKIAMVMAIFLISMSTLVCFAAPQTTPWDWFFNIFTPSQQPTQPTIPMLQPQIPSIWDWFFRRTISPEPVQTQPKLVESLSSTANVVEAPPPKINIKEGQEFTEILQGQSTSWVIKIQNPQCKPDVTIRADLSYWNAPKGVTYIVKYSCMNLVYGSGITDKYTWGTLLNVGGWEVVDGNTLRYEVSIIIGVTSSPTADPGPFSMGIDIYMVTKDGAFLASHLTSSSHT